MTVTPTPCPPTTRWTVLDSPLGGLRATTDGVGLTGLDFVDDLPTEVTARSSVAHHAARGAGLAPDARDDGHPVLVAAAEQLAAYFAGDLEVFDLPLAPVGTPFQLRVWGQLRTIPYGSTATYGDIAARLGLTGHGARAVGLANGRNPIAIVVPCHRVVGAGGSLTGYAGGIDRKRALLDLEQSALF